MIFERKLAIPMEVKEMYPLTQDMAASVAARDRELKDILGGRSRRRVLIIGPCSADREDSVMEYMTRLRRLADDVKEQLLIVPRLYTTKPRTTGDGYKGLLHQPDPSEKPDLFRGIVATRELHRRVVWETGFSCADEMLYPENLKYIDDLVGYVAVGARSVEDQQHRLTASGAGVPVGMKNPTGGDLSVMLNAVSTAQHGHSFIYRGWAAHSAGNPYAHAVLRGRMERDGTTVPNYGYDDLCDLCDRYEARGLMNPAVIVDTNHANSGKDPLRQPEIMNDVLASCASDARVDALVKGFMVESYLEDGCQPVGGGVYGRSITDPCLGWGKTERLVKTLAERLAQAPVIH